jgi:hypothetical protein
VSRHAQNKRWGIILASATHHCSVKKTCRPVNVMKSTITLMAEMALAHKDI